MKKIINKYNGFKSNTNIKSIKNINHINNNNINNNSNSNNSNKYINTTTNNKLSLISPNCSSCLSNHQ